MAEGVGWTSRNKLVAGNSSAPNPRMAKAETLMMYSAVTHNGQNATDTGAGRVHILNQTITKAEP